jgi:hypothetical protein
MQNTSTGFSRLLTTSDGSENTHHYAGHLVAGYYLGGQVNSYLGLAREIVGVATGAVQRNSDLGATDYHLYDAAVDVAMGHMAGVHGNWLAWGMIVPSELGGWIRNQLRP